MIWYVNYDVQFKIHFIKVHPVLKLKVLHVGDDKHDGEVDGDGSVEVGLEEVDGRLPDNVHDGCGQACCQNSS